MSLTYFLVSCLLLTIARAESDVLTLTVENFDNAIKENEVILVEFYAPWCGHCKHLAPEFEKAATQLKEQGIKGKLAAVDADDNTNAELRERFQIQGFPTLKLFRNGVPTDYEGERKAEAIFQTVKRNSLPAITVLSDVEAAKTFSGSEKVVVVGFFNDRESAEYQLFKSTANQLRDSFTFGEVVGDAAINTALESTKVPSIALFKTFDDKRANFDAAGFDGLVNFIKSNSVPLFDEIGPHNFKGYMESGLPLAYLFVDLTVEGQKDQYVNQLNELAKQTQGKLNWVYIDWAKYAKHSERLGLSGKTVPAIAIEKMEEGTHFVFDEAATIAKDAVTEWVNKFVNGEIQPTIKSEAVPEDNNGPVKVVVATQFDEIVNDKTKDVLLEFYAPWCGHCKKLAPVYEELGTSLKESHPNVVIAKIDATANDISPKFGVRGFPTIKLFKAGDKDHPVEYNGDRSLADMKEFILQNTGAEATEQPKDEL